MGLEKSHPPRWADRFLEWYCRPDRLEEIQGDAYELYYRKIKDSKAIADLQFVWNILRFFRLKNIRKTKAVNNDTIITIGMLKNIFKVAIRNFLHQPGHSFLSVLGLTVSFASAFLILLWITHEFSFDRFHDQHQRIFKVMSHVETNGTLETYDAAAVGMDLSSIPEAEQHVTVISGARWPNELCFKSKEKADECIYLNGIYAQPSLFSTFNFSILQGETNPFEKIESIAISEKMSERLFNTKDVIGKTLSIDGWFEVTITSVFKDIPSNSSVQFDFAMPIAIFQRMRGLKDDQLAANFFSTFIKTNTDIGATELTKKLNDPLVLTERLKNDKVSYSAFPFTDWRLKSTFENGQSVGGRIEYVILFIIIAILVVAMAVINFINLSTAKASTRSKEIGIRKVTGAVRSSIIFQFVSESFVIVVFAFVMAAVLAQLTLPFFNNLIGEQISVQLLSGWIPLYMLGFLVVIAMAAGLYPAFVMSSFQPVKVLKGELTTRHSGAQYLRKVLLVVQLSVSIGIIIFSGVLFSQLTFITNKNLGYDRENMVRIEPTYKLLQQYESFKNELLADPNIKSVTATNANPLSLTGHTTGVSWSGKPDDMRVTFQTLGCNYEFLETFGLTILEGRSFQPKPVDTIGTEILVSEEAIKVMGLTNPIGERIKVGDSPCVIIGVVNNFHTEDLRNKQLPVIIYPQPILNCSAIYVKYQEGTTQQAMETVQAVYKKMEPAFTMKYWFQDETFDNLYKTEITASYTVMLFTIVSLIIAVIGVVGLSTYNVIRKKKEIGIKRVFGASTGNILAMLTKEFVVVILLATLLAVPFAWFGASRWLSGFAYAIDMPWWIFAMTFAGMSALIILIICVQGYKTVVTNPTKTLRSE